MRLIPIPKAATARARIHSGGSPPFSSVFNLLLSLRCSLFAGESINLFSLSSCPPRFDILFFLMSPPPPIWLNRTPHATPCSYCLNNAEQHPRSVLLLFSQAASRSWQATDLQSLVHRRTTLSVRFPLYPWCRQSFMSVGGRALGLVRDFFACGESL